MYQSPLHIIPKDRIEDLSPTNLKRIKSEILLQLQLGQRSTISINGTQYDKNSILEAFEMLKEQLDWHLQLFNNQKLLQFLENGTLNFFRDQGAIKNLEQSEVDVKEWIMSLFCRRLSSLYLNWMSNPSIRHLNLMKQIHISSFQLLPEEENLVFARTFRFLENFIAEAKDFFVNPFVGNSATQLRPELKDYVLGFYMQIYEYLPKENFIELKYSYGIWCNQIVYKVFYDGKAFHQIDHNSLSILQIAARNASKVFNKEGNKSIAESIGVYLFNTKKRGWKRKHGKVNRKRDYSSLIYLIVFLLLIVVRWTDSCSTTSSSTQQTPFLLLDQKENPSSRQFYLDMQPVHTQILFQDFKLLPDTLGKTYAKMEVDVEVFPSIFSLGLKLSDLLGNLKDNLNNGTYLLAKMKNKQGISRNSLFIVDKTSGHFRLQLLKSPISAKKIVLNAAFKKQYKMLGNIKVATQKSSFFVHCDVPNDSMRLVLAPDMHDFRLLSNIDYVASVSDFSHSLSFAEATVSRLYKDGKHIVFLKQLSKTTCDYRTFVFTLIIKIPIVLIIFPL